MKGSVNGGRVNEARVNEARVNAGRGSADKVGAGSAGAGSIIEAGAKPSYTGVAKLLHWLIALIILGMLPLGFYMSGLKLSPQKLQLYSWHKWAGVTVFLLVLIRILWRIGNRPPSLPGHMKRHEQLAAHLGHFALYLLMLAIPLSGWLMSSAKGFQTVWFGVLPLPDLLAKDRELGDLLALVHESLNFILIAVLLGHIGAALKHHFINRDDVLTRILPQRRTH